MLNRLRLAVLMSLVVVSLAVLAVACGDDGDEDSSPTGTAPAATGTPASTSTTGTPAATEQPFTGARDPVEGQAQGSGIPVLTDVRAASHTGYDRIAFEFDGNERPHYRVEYITPPATGCGSGETATVAGTAILRVQFMPANAHNETGGSSSPQELTPALTVLQEAELICDFEADVQWALGLTEEADFRVLELDSPPRIAVDVAHP